MSVAQADLVDSLAIQMLNTSSATLPAYANGTDFGDAILPTAHNRTAASRARIGADIWMIPCYSIILIFAVVGNLLVISTLVQNRRMRTITNLFLLNLAISDILLGVLCMPVTLVGTLLRHFIFGEFLCKLFQFSQAASVAVSSWTLVAISCERYYAICHPLRSRSWQTLKHAYKIITGIWLASIVCMTPIAVFSQLMPTSRQGLRKCRELWPEYALGYERSYNIFLLLVLLVLPLLILCTAYVLITRTLYVSMQNERAMIFGNSSSKFNSRTPPMYVTMEPFPPAAAPAYTFHMPDSSNACSSEDIYDAKTHSKFAQLCYDDRSHGEKGNPRKICSFANRRRHLYCMRSAASFRRPSLQRPYTCHNGKESECESDTERAYQRMAGQTASSSASTSGCRSQTQAQRFKWQVQRFPDDQTDQYKMLSMANSRTADTVLRRTNTTKNLESKRRVVKMMFVLVLEFFICWTPLYVINTLAMFIGPTLYEYVDYRSISVFQLLAYSSSCCNPITYCFMNASFRRAFLDTFKGLQCRDGQLKHTRSKAETSFSAVGNSITVVSTGTVVTTNTLLDSPRL